MRTHNVFIRCATSFTLAIIGVMPHAVLAQQSNVVTVDQQGFQAKLKAMGHKRRGGIDRQESESGDQHFQSLPHFSSSFSVKGTTYPYTMLGYPPQSGDTAQLKSVIVPLRMRFAGFGASGNVAVDFDPSTAVKNMLNSPMYQDATFPNGFGQFGDLMQRATFWNKMDKAHQWHVKMAPPRVMKTIDIEVTPETATSLFLVNGHYFGDVYISFLDAQIKTILQLTPIDPDEVPIFVTQNVTAEALGYHDAFPVSNDDGKVTLQTLIYTSWLDPRLVDPLFADVSTFNHELGEWLNDPFVNNVVPDWMYPPPNDKQSVCSGNPFLEVGDPQGNGPTYRDFPTYTMTVNGVLYHLQQLVMLPWFADEKPSSAQNGWYTFPIPTGLTVPAVYCP